MKLNLHVKKGAGVPTDDPRISVSKNGTQVFLNSSITELLSLRDGYFMVFANDGDGNIYMNFSQVNKSGYFELKEQKNLKKLALVCGASKNGFRDGYLKTGHYFYDKEVVFDDDPEKLTWVRLTQTKK